jgi:hypothetical protein
MTMENELRKPRKVDQVDEADEVRERVHEKQDGQIRQWDPEAR